jgi:hypothetical protein
MARYNTKITLNPGTPINVQTALGLENNAVLANRLFIQMATGGTGLGYVMGGIGGGRTPATTNANDVSAELSPASATAPGGNYMDGGGGIQFSLTPGIDLSTYWIDGTEADPVRISADINV